MATNDIHEFEIWALQPTLGGQWLYWGSEDTFEAAQYGAWTLEDEGATVKVHGPDGRVWDHH